MSPISFKYYVGVNSPSENNGGTFFTRMQITIFLVVFNLSKLSPADCYIWQCYPPLFSSRALVTLLKSWILLSCLLLTLAGPHHHHVSTLQLLQANWQSRPGCVESRTDWLSHSQSHSQSLTSLGKHQTFPQSDSPRPPPPGYANYIQKKPPAETATARNNRALSFH